MPAGVAAHLLVGAINEASMTIAHAADVDQARRDAMDTIHLMLDGILRPSTRG